MTCNATTKKTTAGGARRSSAKLSKAKTHELEDLPAPGARAPNRWAHVKKSSEKYMHSKKEALSIVQINSIHLR